MHLIKSCLCLFQDLTYQVDGQPRDTSNLVRLATDDLNLMAEAVTYYLEKETSKPLSDIQYSCDWSVYGLSI